MGKSSIYFTEKKTARVASKMKTISKEYEELFMDLGKQIFSDLVEIKDVSEMMMNCIKHIEKAVTVFDKYFPDFQSVACTTGCHYCCYFPIECPPQVAVDIARFIRSNMNDKQRQRLVTKMEKDRADRESPFFRAKCPFLDENKLCLIYERRPLSCRWFTSSDVQLCKQSVMDGTNIPQRATHHRIYQVATTMLLACSKSDHKHHKQVPFITSVLEILKMPENINQWKGYDI